LLTALRKRGRWGWMDNAGENTLGRTTLAKITWRLLPFMFLLYIVAFLDRVNVGFAALQMKGDLGFSDTVYGIGAGIFFIGYFVFEIPSNLILERVGARVWIARIMLTWGVISSAMFLVSGETSFYILRFLLGVAEAGFFPGMILYLTYWFPARERARRVALFMTAIPISGVIGSPISGALLTLDGFAGLAGWQIMFLAEGIPAILLGILVLRYLPNGPDEAGWLEPEERGWLRRALERENRIKSEHGEYTTRQALANGKVWLLSAIYFGVVTSVYGVSLWLPLIIEDLSGFGNFAVGLLSVIPYFAGAVGMVLFARHSDATGERRWHVAVAAFIATVGLILTGATASDGFLERHGGGGGDRAYQLRREPRRVRRSLRGRVLERRYRELLCGAAAPGRLDPRCRALGPRREARAQPGGSRGCDHPHHRHPDQWLSRESRHLCDREPVGGVHLQDRIG
jgi:MFS transporter, ACS family, tartrate transporter